MRPRAATKIAGSGRLWQGKLQVKPSHPRKVATVAGFLPYRAHASVHNLLSLLCIALPSRMFSKKLPQLQQYSLGLYKSCNFALPLVATTCHFAVSHTALFFTSVYHALEGGK